MSKVYTTFIYMGLTLIHLYNPRLLSPDKIFSLKVSLAMDWHSEKFQ